MFKRMMHIQIIESEEKGYELTLIDREKTEINITSEDIQMWKNINYIGLISNHHHRIWISPTAESKFIQLMPSCNSFLILVNKEVKK